MRNKTMMMMMMITQSAVSIQQIQTTSGLDNPVSNLDTTDTDKVWSGLDNPVHSLDTTDTDNVWSR